MAENNMVTKLDPEKVAAEILGKVFNIKLEECKLWRWGIAKFTNNESQLLGEGSICFVILKAAHIPHGIRGLEVLNAFEKKFLDIAFKKMSVMNLPKEDRSFIWMSLFGSGAPIGVLVDGDYNWLRDKRFEGFSCESLEQALIEFSLKEGIALGND